MSSRSRELTVLKLLAKGRTVVFTANACDLLPKDVTAIAREHGVLNGGSIVDGAAAEAAVARLEATAAPKIPVREPAPARPTPAVARRQDPSPGRTTSGFAFVDVRRIDTDGRNVRDELGDLTELAVSIRQVGILQPLTVVARGERYALEVGHRRLGAALLAGLTTVPCMIRAPRDETSTRVVRLIENLHRRALSPMEEAAQYQILRDAGLTQSDIARRVGVSAATVSTRLMLLALPDEAQEMVRDKRLPLTEATALAKQVRATGAGAVDNKPPSLPDYWATHPLRDEVWRQCGHLTRRRYGGPRGGCGACWEAVIRSDEGLRLLTKSTTRKDFPA